jgi:hypothetical protein
VTSQESAGTVAPAAADDGVLYCYRHPDRQTYIRCGRCDRPICTRCAMQGPVGFRCRECGTLAYDPLTSFRPGQVALGLAVAGGGGIVLGLIAGVLGWLTIFVAFIGGGMISEAVIRTTGYKRGPLMLAIVLGGIVAGVVVGSVALLLFSGAQVGRPGGAADIGAQITNALPWLLVAAGAACVGAYPRLR